MVFLKVKNGQDYCFNLDASVKNSVDEVLAEVVKVYNHRLKLLRICDEMTQLAKHGVQIRPEMMGLTPDQIVELKLIDEYASSCVPSTGFGDETPDEVGRRCGRPPRTDMKNIIAKTIAEALATQPKEPKKATDFDKIDEQISNLRGAVMIVYPMGLPPYDHIRLEFENNELESLAGTQASKSIIDDGGSIWFAGKQMQTGIGKTLADYMGGNDKSRVVIKIQKKSAQGAPAKEAPVTQEEHKFLMSKMYKRQEELKKLAEEAEYDEDSYLGAQWADSSALKKQFQGLNNIRGLGN